jgi:drug/metabolite transporter (DMT)-like permease
MHPALLLILSSFFFTAMQVCIKMLPNLPTSELVFFRGAIALVLSYAAIKSKGIPVLGTNKKLLLLRGIFGTVALYAFFYTIKVMPLASAVTIHYLAPIFTIIIAGIVFKEKANKWQWLCFAICFCGVLLLKGFDSRVSTFDMLIAVFGAAGAAAAYNVIRALKDSEDTMVIILYFPLVVVPCIAPLAYREWVMPQGIEWLLVLFIGIFTQTAQVFMTKAYQRAEAAKIAHLNYLGAINAAVLGWVFFGETIAIVSALGISLVIAGAIGGLKAKK